MKSMKTTAAPIVATLALLGVTPSATAQLLTARDGPVVYGHYHLHVTSIDEHKKFWVDTLGGKALKVGPLESIEFPNVFIFLQQTKPDGGKGTTIDHIAFQVANLRAVVDKLKAANYAVTTRADVNRMYSVKDDIATMPDQHMLTAFAVGPDEARVELIEHRNAMQQPVAPAGPIAFDHVHVMAQDFTAMKQWYAKTFGAKIGSQTFLSKGLDLPGLPSALQFSRVEGAAFSLTGSPAPYSSPAGVPAMIGTKNHVVDHLGFEVKGLEAFCQQLEKSGIKLDMSYRKVPAVGLSIAFVTDPWGTSIELTEGLNALP